ncbi:MAG: SDR family oxidoreductase [Gammaproteobacteria bacterium]|nr:SDR family oxidoreductase [Gammaproteobacteria bacterium]
MTGQCPPILSDGFATLTISDTISYPARDQIRELLYRHFSVCTAPATETVSGTRDGWSDNIRCNSVHPGIIWTNMQAQVTGLQAPQDVHPSRVPLGRMGEPQDIANCILYLASDESNYVTGAEFTVDAGMTAQ